MPEQSKKSPADGAWARLENLETTATAKLGRVLESFQVPFRDTYEAGLIAPVLRNEALIDFDMRCAALHLKRVLNDFRCVWILLRLGYAGVASSLHEHALATCCLTHSAENSSKYLLDEFGGCSLESHRDGKNESRKRWSQNWFQRLRKQLESDSSPFTWLCQIKHPTIDSVVHDTSSSVVKDAYVVMAMPNVLDQDAPVKANIAILTLIRTHEAIQAI